MLYIYYYHCCAATCQRNNGDNNYRVVSVHMRVLLYQYHITYVIVHFIFQALLNIHMYSTYLRMHAVGGERGIKIHVLHRELLPWNADLAREL